MLSPYLPFTEIPDTDVYILISVLYLMKFIKSCTSIKFIKWNMWYWSVYSRMRHVHCSHIDVYRFYQQLVVSSIDLWHAHLMIFDLFSFILTILFLIVIDYSQYMYSYFRFVFTVLFLEPVHNLHMTNYLNNRK